MIELSSLLSRDFGLDAGLLSLGIVFSIAALAFIPRPPLCVLGGLFFGLAAFPVALAGTTLGAVVAFLVSRYLFRARFSVIAGRRPRLKLVLDPIDAEGQRLELPVRADQYRRGGLRRRHVPGIGPAGACVRLPRHRRPHDTRCPIRLG